MGEGLTKLTKPKLELKALDVNEDDENENTVVTFREKKLSQVPKLRTMRDYELPDTSQSYQRLRVEDEFDLINTEVLGTDKLV